MGCTTPFSLLGDLFEIFRYKEFLQTRTLWHVSTVRGIIITSIILKLKKLNPERGFGLPQSLSVCGPSQPRLEKQGPHSLPCALLPNSLLPKVGPTNTISLEC